MVSAKQIELTDGETQGMRKDLTINRNTVSIAVKEKPVFVLTTVNMPTTLPELSGRMPEIMLYPNPVRDRVIVKITNPDQVAGPANIVIHNLTGEIIYQKNAILPDTDGTWQIDVKELSSGTYILELVFHDCSIVKKLVKIQ